MKVVKSLFEITLCEIMTVHEIQFEFMPERGTIDPVLS